MEKVFSVYSPIVFSRRNCFWSLWVCKILSQGSSHRGLSASLALDSPKTHIFHGCFHFHQDRQKALPQHPCVLICKAPSDTVVCATQTHCERSTPARTLTSAPRVSTLLVTKFTRNRLVWVASLIVREQLAKAAVRYDYLLQHIFVSVTSKIAIAIHVKMSLPCMSKSRAPEHRTLPVLQKSR